MLLNEELSSFGTRDGIKKENMSKRKMSCITEKRFMHSKKRKSYIERERSHALREKSHTFKEKDAMNSNRK